MLGCGEAGVRTIDRDAYYHECDPETIVSIMCGYFGVAEPTAIKSNPRPKDGWHWRGWYNPNSNTISYNMPLTGLIIHETAHHICHEQGYNACHDCHFKDILQQMHDFWR